MVSWRKQSTTTLSTMTQTMIMMILQVDAARAVVENDDGALSVMMMTADERPDAVPARPGGRRITQ